VLAVRVAEARGQPGPLFVSCLRHGADLYGAAGIGPDGRVRFELPLPGRGHSTAFHPTRPECVVFARRPGIFAVVIDHDEGTALRRIDAAPGRHFYGHGAFADDGRHLFASENAYEAGEGVLGIYDAADGYRRVGELASHGIGPHDVRLLADGGTLLVANGGIRTHPDYGRIKLNLPDMRPALAFVDTADGRLLELVGLEPRLHQLSIRHLARGAGGIVGVALQDEDTGSRLRPLVAVLRAGRFEILMPPPAVLARMRRYTGSAAFDSLGTILAVSAPRGGLVTFWDTGAAADEAFIRHVDFPDGCGVAAADAPGCFLLTSGTGAILRCDARTGALQWLLPAAPGRIAWDNHLMPTA
jgi:hypothetical protein